MAKGWRCWIGVHRYHKIWDHERSRQLKECRDCGRRETLGWAGPAPPVG